MRCLVGAGATPVLEPAAARFEAFVDGKVARHDRPCPARPVAPGVFRRPSPDGGQPADRQGVPATSWASRCSCASSANPGRPAGPGRVRSPSGPWTSSAVSSTWTGEARRLRGAVRDPNEHLAACTGSGPSRVSAARELVERLREEAFQAQSNEDLVRQFVEACRRTRTSLPATTTTARLGADALVRRGTPGSKPATTRARSSSASQTHASRLTDAPALFCDHHGEGIAGGAWCRWDHHPWADSALDSVS